MLGLHSICQLNVFLHGILFAGSLEAVPRVPFGLPLKIPQQVTFEFGAI